MPPMTPNMPIYPPGQGQYGHQFPNMEDMPIPQINKKGSSDMMPGGHPIGFHPAAGIPYEMSGLPIPGMPVPHMQNQMMPGQAPQRGAQMGIPPMGPGSHPGKGTDMETSSSRFQAYRSARQQQEGSQQPSTWQSSLWSQTKHATTTPG